MTYTLPQLPRSNLVTLNRARLEALLANFPNLTIGLVGDLFLDRYLDIEPEIEELSIETGLEAYQIPSVRNSPGALGTVMNNLAALGVGRLIPVTVIGDDGHGYELLRAVGKLPIDDSHIIQDRDRLTPTYTKPMRREASGVWRELNRLDFRSRGRLTSAATSTLVEHVRGVFDTCDGMIVLDQINEPNWGVVNDETRQVLYELSQTAPDKLMFIDSRAHVGQFDFGILKGNRSELLGALDNASDAAGTIESAALRLAKRNGQCVFATVGELGIVIAQPDGEVIRTPGFPVSGPVDIVGAGDSATSGIVAALLSHAEPEEAATIGNLVASVTVRQLGTTGTASPEQVLARYTEVAP